jgi:AcrR family transcriptional regulator
MGTPRPVRTAVTKQKLFDAALRLIGERGPAEVTVDQIAAEAEVAKGSVYYNFGSKDGLVDALLRHGVSLFAARLREAELEDDPAQAIERLVDGSLGFYADYPAFAQLLISEMWRTPGHWHDTMTLLRDDILSIFRAVFVRLEEAGHLTPGVDVDTAATALFGALYVVTLDWLTFHPDRPKDQVRDAVLLLVQGLLSAART